MRHTIPKFHGTLCYICNCRMEYITGSGTICQELNNTISGIQTGTIEDKKGWIVEVD